MPELEKKEKFIIVSGLVLVSSLLIYRISKIKNKKKSKYSLWEAILVDINSIWKQALKYRLVFYWLCLQ